MQYATNQRKRKLDNSFKTYFLLCAVTTGKGTIEHFFEDNVIEANKNIDIDYTTNKIVDNSRNEGNDLSMCLFMGLSQAKIRTVKEQGFSEEEIRQMGEEKSLDPLRSLLIHCIDALYFVHD